MEEIKKTYIFKNFLWAINTIFSLDSKYIVLNIFSLIMKGVTPAIYVLLTQKIINSLQLNDNRIMIFLLGYIIIELIEGVYSNFFEYYRIKFNLNINLKVKELIMSKISKLKLQDFEDSETYDVINRARNESEGKVSSYIDGFLYGISSIITLVSFIGIIVSFKIWIVVIILVIPCIKYVISKKINTMSFNIIMNRTNRERKSWYIQYLLTYGDFFKELKLNNLFSYFSKKYIRYNLEFNEQDIKLARQKMLLMVSATAIEIIIDGFIFYKIINYGYAGEILIGSVVMYMSSISRSKMKLTEILQLWATTNKESFFMDQLIYFFNLPEKGDNSSLEIDRIERIECKDLSFKYKKEDTYILKKLSFKIEKNEKIAIVGRNGSGKTTLIKILLGFYDDYEGNIYVNGIDLRDINRNSYMKKVSCLFQDFIKYEGTFRENIAYGNLEYIDCEEKLYSVAKMFDLSTLIRNSEKKIDSQIGYWFDNGKQISLGEWQKVALARTVIKDSDLVVLDEPNSSLDAISEYRIRELYNNVLEGKIGIIIIHKFKNITTEMNRILVLNNGHIEEEGTHNELIRLDGIYTELYKCQD